MPLAPSTYCEPMPVPACSRFHHRESRRPPLPSSLHPRALSKIALIRPKSSTSLISRSPSPSSCSLSSRSSASSRLPLVDRHQLRVPRSPPLLCSLRTCTCERSAASPTPARRLFPQEVNAAEERLDLQQELSSKEQAPVVFDASLNFVLGIERQQVRQSFRPTASHLEPQTASSCLSAKIFNFLQRTDHIMDEWRRCGRASSVDDSAGCCDGKSPACVHQERRRQQQHLGRSRSATNIMIKGYQYFSRASSVGRNSSSRPVSRLSKEEQDEEEGTICDDEVYRRRPHAPPLFLSDCAFY